VSETAAALEALCRALAEATPRSVTWYLDSPVSNSGRLKSWLSNKFVETGLTWQVELVANADRALVDAGGVVASSDTWVIDSAEAWIDLPGELIQRNPTSVWLVDLRAQAKARTGQT